MSKNFAAAALESLIFLSACASSHDARGPFPDTPDPAGARRLARDWVFAMKDGDHEVDGKLHFTYDGTFLAGTLTGMGGDVQQLSEIRASKDRVAWKLAGDRGAELLVGTFADDGTLSGKMTRVRKRDSQSSDNQGDSSSGSDIPPAEQPHGGGGRGGGRHHGGGGHGGGSRSGNGSAKWSAVPAAKEGGEK